MKRQIILFLLMTVSLSSIGQISCTATGTDETCGQSNGTITVTPIGNCPSGFSFGCFLNQTPCSCSGLAAGTYDIIVTCGTDSCSTSVTVNNIPGPTCQILNTANDTDGECSGALYASASGGTPPYTYYWNNGQNDSIATDLCTGIYTVTVTDANNCSSTDTGTIFIILSINDFNDGNDISIFPNPTNGIFTIDFSYYNKPDFSIELSDIIGKIVLTKKITDIKMNVDISTFPQGFYYLKIYNKQKILNKKILKE